MRRNSDGDRINALLPAAGDNFCLLRRWSRSFCAACYRSSVIAGHRCTPHRFTYENVLHRRPIRLTA